MIVKTASPFLMLTFQVLVKPLIASMKYDVQPDQAA